MAACPLFLAHHFPGMLVQAVDLDPVVLAAATQAMGFPTDRCLLCFDSLDPKTGYVRAAQAPKECSMLKAGLKAMGSHACKKVF